MPDDRRRFMEGAIKDCGDLRLQQLLSRLEEDAKTSGDSRIPVVAGGIARNEVAIFAKLPFQDATGVWRYGLFDAARCGVREGRTVPLEEPFLTSRRTWRRKDVGTYLPPAVERRRRTGPSRSPSA